MPTQFIWGNPGYPCSDHCKIIGSAGAARRLRECRLETRYGVAHALRQLRWRSPVLFLPARIGASGKERFEHFPCWQAISHFRHIMLPEEIAELWAEWPDLDASTARLIRAAVMSREPKRLRIAWTLLAARAELARAVR